MVFMHSRPTRRNQAIPARSTLAVTIAGTLILGTVALPLRADPADQATLIMTFPALKGHDGAIMIAIFANEAAYAQSKQPICSIKLPSNAAVPEVAIKALAPGRYAAKIFHDVNGNGELDANVFGVPTEPYAFSNNATGTMAPASWSDAAFTVTPTGQTVQTITLE
jgi:uncharacterized protein (DUF2141 family)